MASINICTCHVNQDINQITFHFAWIHYSKLLYLFKSSVNPHKFTGKKILQESAVNYM